jgi:hypothetical protein
MEKSLPPVHQKHIRVVIQLRGSSFSLYSAVNQDALVAAASTHALNVWVDALHSLITVQLLYPGWDETRYSSLERHEPECDAVVMMYDADSGEESSGAYRKHILSQYIDTGKLLYSIGEGSAQTTGIEIVRDTVALEEIGFIVGECTELVAWKVLRIILADLVEKYSRVQTVIPPPDGHISRAPDGHCRVM